MKRSIVMALVASVSLMACGESEPTDTPSTDTEQTSGKQGKGDFIGGEEEQAFGNFEADGELAELATYLLEKQGMLAIDGEASRGEGEGVACTSFGEGYTSCSLQTSKVEITGDRTNQLVWLEGASAETLYTWMSELAQEDESITETLLASGDAYTRGNVSCSWSSGTAPGCLLTIGDDASATPSKQDLARADEGFLVLDGAIATGIGVVLEEAGLVTEMPKIDLKVGESDGLRCSYDLEDVPMCEIDAARASLIVGSGIAIEGDVASNLYTILDELEAGGSEVVERRLLASGEELAVQGFSCSWTSGNAPSCFAE